jgi:hypothetical protein
VCAARGCGVQVVFAGLAPLHASVPSSMNYLPPLELEGASIAQQGALGMEQLKRAKKDTESPRQDFNELNGRDPEHNIAQPITGVAILDYPHLRLLPRLRFPLCSICHAIGHNKCDCTKVICSNGDDGQFTCNIVADTRRFLSCAP